MTPPDQGSDQPRPDQPRPDRQGPKRPARRHRPASPHRPPAVDPPRLAAYDVLKAVREQDAYANLVLPGLLRERRIEGRDAALATELAYGALRGQGLYDAVLQACVDRPLADVDPPVRDVLRLGAHQLLRTRIPSHASVSATVDLARRVLSAGPVGFVNAVLRKVAAQDLDAWVAQLSPPDDRIGGLALRHSHPRWVASAFLDALRGDVDELDRLLEADDARPTVHLVARRMDRDELVAQSGGTAGPWSPRAVRLDEGDPGAVAAVRHGTAGVQDEGSQLMALALAAAPLDGPDRLWVDLCAGPGGKAALLEAVAAERDATLVAVELQPHRSRLVARSGVAHVVTADGRTPPLPDGCADRVLLDAPCSGLGALRRRPEARWRRQPSDLPGLARLQGELLDAAVRLLRPGGVLAYVTCSPHLAETVVPVLDVLRRHPGLEQLDARPLLPGVPDLGAGPAVQLWPHRHGTDAMHLAVLRRSD
ncbi:MAG: transcription antitermination factor NusB [Mycobacteriales bacterium]|nr:transcription antitermination factor NusB [Mycobacteriales bacterium]